MDILGLCYDSIHLYSLSIIRRTGEAISKQPDNAKGLVVIARNVTVLSWCFYPVVFIFPMIGIEGSNAYTAIQVDIQ